MVIHEALDKTLIHHETPKTLSPVSERSELEGGIIILVHGCLEKEAALIEITLCSVCVRACVRACECECVRALVCALLRVRV